MAVEYNKSTCEMYNLRSDTKWDYANITIDDTGLLQSHTDMGDYAYKWGAYGTCFKSFLVRIDPEYLLNKVTSRNYFCSSDYKDYVKTIILKNRRDYNLTANEAREIWEFIEWDIGDNDPYEMVCQAIGNHPVINKLYDGDAWFSEIMPELEYEPTAIVFAFKIFPEFVEILKKELKLT